MKLERKDFPALVISTDDEKGIVEAIVSVIGNIDLGDDIIHPGSFTKTLQERFGKIKVLDNHNSFSILNALGKPLEMRELSKGELPKELLDKYPLASGGLYTKTQYAIDTNEGLGAFKRIKAGIITEYSIGFSIPKGKWDITDNVVDGIKKKIRNIREIILYEYSPVLWGMNDATMTIGAKSELSLIDKYFKVSEAFEMMFMNHDDHTGYYCMDSFDTYVIAKACNIETEYQIYKVNYTHNDDYTEFNFADTTDWQGGNYEFVVGAKTLEEIQELKAGRMISSANLSKIQAALDALQELVNLSNSGDALDNSDNNITNNDNKSTNTEVDTSVTDNSITSEQDLELFKARNLAYLNFIRSKEIN